MTDQTQTAIVNTTLVIATLAFVLVVAVGYLTGASMSSMAVKGLSSIVGIGMVGWLVMRLVSFRGVMRELPEEPDLARSEDSPFAGFGDDQL